MSKLKNKEWLELIYNSLENKSVKYDGYHLPKFPNETIQKNTTGQEGRKTLLEAFEFYEDCLIEFEKSKAFYKKEKVLLDFGTGWGRILRFFLKDFNPDFLYGVDINESLLKICQNTFEWGKFIKCEAFPPLDFNNESLDFIVGYSVFSHLSEMASRTWLEEFNRILRSGGMVAVTTRGIGFLDYCESLKSKENTGYTLALSNLFDDFKKAKEDYNSGLFVHSNVDGVSGGFNF